MESPTETAATPVQIKTIVALIDFSEGTPRIVEHAKALARAFSSNVVLLHGVPRQPETVDIALASPVMMRDPTAEEWDSHKDRLLEINASFKADGINVTAGQFEGITADSVQAESNWLAADLIIMGSHHHSALHDLFVGNITHDVLQRSTCPVLVIPAVEPAPAAAEAQA